MRKRLRKVSKLPAFFRVKFFREQADIIAKRQQAIQGDLIAVPV
jgi:hypothetical protein